MSPSGEIAETIAVAGEAWRLEFDLRSGTLSLHGPEEPVFSGALGRIVLRAEKGLEAVTTAGSWDVGSQTPTGFECARRDVSLRLLLRVGTRDGWPVVELGVAWEGDSEPPVIDAIVPLAVPPGGLWPSRENNRHWRFYQNGWQCWTPSGTLKRGRPGDYLYPLFLPKALKSMLANTATPMTSEKGSFESEWFGGLADLEAGDSFVLGFVGLNRALSRVSARIGRSRAESELQAAAMFEGRRSQGKETLWSEPLALIPGDLTGANLESYAGLLAAGQGVEEVRPGPVGWCSWYHYFTGITAAEVEKNVELIDGRYAELDIELVQVDDGFQPTVGDWLETNDGFPSGMRELADRIASRGRMPGIWIAPFTVTRKSEVFREHRDWVLSKRRGRPLLAGINPLWGGRFHGLDVTNPAVLQWVREIFEAVAGWGFRFIKLDFMATAMLEGKRFDPSVTRAEAMHRALQVIRKAVGPDVYVMAAGGPVLMGAGTLDSQRVSGDVAPYWQAFYQPLVRDRSTPGVRNCLINVFTRYFLSGRVFEGDPDCLMVRSGSTKLSDVEKRTLASVISIFGGALLLSDDLSLWGEEEEELLATVLPHIRAKPWVPDIWTSEMPRLMVSRLEDPYGEYFNALVVNWSRFPRTFDVKISELGLEPGRYHAHEFWTESYLGEVTDSLSLEDVPGHGAAVVRLTPTGSGSMLVGSNIHLSQGAAELERFDVTGDRLRLAFSSPVRRKVRVTMALPREVRAGRGPGPEDISVSRLKRGIFRVEFTVEGRTEIELDWAG